MEWGLVEEGVGLVGLSWGGNRASRGRSRGSGRSGASVGKSRASGREGMA